MRLKKDDNGETYAWLDERHRVIVGDPVRVVLGDTSRGEMFRHAHGLSSVTSPEMADGWARYFERKYSQREMEGRYHPPPQRFPLVHDISPSRSGFNVWMSSRPSLREGCAGCINKFDTRDEAVTCLIARRAICITKGFPDAGTGGRDYYDESPHPHGWNVWSNRGVGSKARRCVRAGYAQKGWALEDARRWGADFVQQGLDGPVEPVGGKR